MARMIAEGSAAFEERTGACRSMQAEPVENHLLAGLSTVARERLSPHLHLTRLPRHEVLHGKGQDERWVYFPLDCVVSLCYVMSDGGSAEVGVIGNDGVVGAAVFMGGHSFPGSALVHSAGCAWRLAAPHLLEEFNRDQATRVLLLRYAQGLMTQMAQNAVCNCYHTIEQRLCRWMLVLLDRVPGPNLEMTQELIANMLGVRRQGVSEAAGRLQKLGAIRYQRGQIIVEDRRRLEALCCECYWTLRGELERLRQSA